jgi:hypothetical protein
MLLKGLGFGGRSPQGCPWQVCRPSFGEAHWVGGVCFAADYKSRDVEGFDFAPIRDRAVSGEADQACGALDGQWCIEMSPC